MEPLEVALVGERNDSFPAHQAIPVALQSAAAARGRAVAIHWIGTAGLAPPRWVDAFDGIWCVPGSPYESQEGALQAIKLARTSGIPFLGTCGGFQHAVLEYARQVCGIAHAAHAESEPSAPDPVIAPLPCALRGIERDVQLLPASRWATIVGSHRIRERFHCGYGPDPRRNEQLFGGALRAAAMDADGVVIAVELDHHPFYFASLFQFECAALHGRRMPLVEAFLEAAAARRDARLRPAG